MDENTNALPDDVVDTETPLTPDPVPSAESEPQADEFDPGVFSTHVGMPGSPESSKDGQWLAYLMPNADGEQELWIAPTNGGDPRVVQVETQLMDDRDPESGRRLRGPQWSPDGSQIAVTGMHPDGDRTAIWIVPTGLTGVVAADDESPAEDAAGDDADAAPDSPAGETAETATELLAEETTDAPSGEPAAEASEPDGPYLLVDHDLADRSPRWSPDGEIISMTTTIDGRDVIALVPVAEADASAVEFLSWSRSNDRESLWSRDGKFLAWLRERTDGPEFHDIMCYSLTTGELQNLTSEKDPAVRHSLEWVPGRNLLAYVTMDGDWQSISVINADNKAGWTVTRESGDKTDPRFAQDEARLVYVRTEGFTTVLCERSLHSSAAVALDPGEGVALYPRWLEGKRIAYAFSAPMRPLGFLVQENLAKSDRTSIDLLDHSAFQDHHLVQPEPFEFDVAPEETFSGLLYRTRGASGKVPGIVYLPDGPLATRRGEFQLDEQALASTALAVLSPVIHGATGFGKAVENDLREFADTELEDTDLAEAGLALGRVEGVDPSKIALVGEGYGGALALITAGARPGVYGAVVAIDPIAEWSIELANTDVPWRNWVTDRFGLPLTNADYFALRTPATFSAVIDVPVVLVQTANASEHRAAQLDVLTQDLDECGIEYQVLHVPDEPRAATLRRVSQELARLFLDGKDHVNVVADLRADDLDSETVETPEASDA